MLQGTPYIYQGEEIGMTNPRFETIDQYRDVESLNAFKELKSKGYSEAVSYTHLTLPTICSV